MGPFIQMWIDGSVRGNMLSGKSRASLGNWEKRNGSCFEALQRGDHYEMKVSTFRILMVVLANFVAAPMHALGQNANEKEYECLELVAVLPIMQNARMQTLANQKEIYNDPSILVKAMEELAQQRDVDALYSLGMLHELGYCVQKKDKATALALYKQAAEQGSAQAQFQFGANKTQCAEKVIWWEKASEQNYRDAQSNLAGIYRAGCPGLPKDLVRAYMLYTVSAMPGDLLRERAELTKEMTPEQIAQGERLARQWAEQHP